METLKGLETLPVFRTVIHVDSAVEWAQDNSTTVVSYRRSSRSAREYLDFAKEVEEKCR
jgi:chromosome partitioning protein